MAEALVHSGSHYDDDIRRQAVVEYSIKGSLQAVSNALGIPRTTLCDWKNSEWWEALSIELRQQTEDRIAAELDQIIEKAHREVLERLEHGDVVRVESDENGSQRLVRAPVRAKDAAVIAGVAFDKRRLQHNQPTSISSRSANDAALAGLADFLRQIAAKDVVSDQ
jgi:hypothetical protein